MHAGVVVPDHDREALERLCRYGARPAFAHERLARTPDGRISYQLKRRFFVLGALRVFSGEGDRRGDREAAAGDEVKRPGRSGHRITGRRC